MATFVKYSADAPVGVQTLGPIHGVLFLAYVFMALTIRPEAGWSTRTTLGVLIGAVLPFRGYVVDRRALVARQSGASVELGAPTSSDH